MYKKVLNTKTIVGIFNILLCIYMANSCISNISPSQFWATSEQYPDLVKHLQQQVRLTGNLVLMVE